jgi:predicted Zn-dependent protease
MTKPKEIAARLVERVKRAERGAQALVRVEVGSESFTRYAVNDITSAGETDIAEVVLTVALGPKHATLKTSQLDESAHEELVAKAVAMAKLAPDDPEWMPVLGPQSYREPGPAYDAATAKVDPQVGADGARAAIAVAKEKGVQGAGFFTTCSWEVGLATSEGLNAEHRGSRAEVSSTARTTDGTGSGWAALSSHRVADVDVRKVAARAVDKAVASQKPRELDPGKYTVVLEPACVATLVSFLKDATDARTAEEQRSYFAKAGGGTRVGEQLLAKGLSLKSDPFDAATPGAPFDGEGLALAPTTWFDSGELKLLSRSRYWAKKAGGAPTGRHESIALAGAGGKSSVDELVASVDKGLLVTRFWYVRWLEPKTMTITGLTRDGVFLIEKGKVTAPVANFRFNDAPVRVLGSATGWTAETVRVPSYDRDAVVRVPGLLAHDFFMASKSAAV